MSAAQTVGKLKRFKRIAMRCDKTQDSYGAFVAFACALILVKSVYGAKVKAPLAERPTWTGWFDQ